MKAITIHYPWAWAIVRGFKKVENRNWKSSHRGPLLIHAGFSQESDLVGAECLEKLGVKVPPRESFVRGKIIGMVDLVDILPLDDYLEEYGHDPLNRGLAFGKYCWVIENPKICEPIPCSGNFQLWPAERAIAKKGGDPAKLLLPSRFRANHSTDSSRPNKVC